MFTDQKDEKLKEKAFLLALFLFKRLAFFEKKVNSCFFTLALWVKGGYIGK